MPIRVLDAATIGRIAAGEVVERPSSIVKELIENSLDAGATSITVEIKDGGVTYIRVTDNGCGIPPEEARMAFENHATSKISSGDSLSDILTLGFRGEALPSIAAVARVTMTTRARGREAGIKIQVEGGYVKDVSEAGCPEGTTIVVRDLFFNLPVRRDFLKKPATEAGVVSDMVARLILGNPSTAMRLISNDRSLYHSFGDGDIRHAALAVYGREIAEKLMVIDESEGSLRISGLVGLDELARPNRAQEFFFINGRTVRTPLITQALERSARTRVMIGQYPMCALSLRLPASAVDINVHPSKLEVRFKDEAEIGKKAEMMLTRACCGTKMLDPEVITSAPVQVEERPPITIQSAERTSILSGMPDQADAPPIMAKSEPPKREEPMHVIYADRAPELQRFQESQRYSPQEIVMPPHLIVEKGSGDAPESAVLPVMPAREKRIESVTPDSQKNAADQASIRVIGVFIDTYIVAELGDTLILIDQHAAHERILYEQFKASLEGGTAMQQLLTPLVMSMSARERNVLLDNQALLLEAGYEIEPFGERDVQVRAVPYILGQADLRPLFAELIDRLDQLKAAAIDRRRGEIITASCKKAVKAGDHLSEAEIQSLIDEMLKTDAPPTCPHGRPVLKTFKKSEIERMFRRA